VVRPRPSLTPLSAERGVLTPQLVALVGAHSKMVTALCMWSAPRDREFSSSPRLPSNPNPHLDSITNYDALLGGDGGEDAEEDMAVWLVRIHLSPSSSTSLLGRLAPKYPLLSPPKAEWLQL
jgi:hypothetical protein